MNIFGERLNAIYQKKKINIEGIEHFELIPLIKWLSLDKDNILYLAKVLEYRWYIRPEHVFYLLTFLTPKKSRAPYFGKLEKFEETTNKLLEKIKYINSWSDKELRQNLSILEKTILTDSKRWKALLAVK